MFYLGSEFLKIAEFSLAKVAGKNIFVKLYTKNNFYNVICKNQIFWIKFFAKVKIQRTKLNKKLRLSYTYVLLFPLYPYKKKLKDYTVLDTLIQRI